MTRGERYGLLVVALTCFGCGRELVQTAYREPQEPENPGLSCAERPASAEAPSWAAGELEESPLVAQSYGGGEGPGIWIAARDHYRLYLNGALLAEGSEPRAATFVPLSLLPGDNVLALVIWAEQGTPAALVQVDELTRSYVSDDSWLLSSAPGTDFAEPEHESPSTEWLAPTDHGQLGALPGCDPLVGFPQESLARWLGPELGSGTSAVLRRVIRVAPIGFGAAATGGGASEPVLARTWAELEALASEPGTPATIVLPEGEYDFRRLGDEAKPRLVCPAACSDDPEKMTYEVLSSSETCALPQIMMPLDERTLKVGSNKTIAGLGRGASLRGVSLELGTSENVVIRNLAFFDVNPELIEAGDAIGMEGARDVWIDHVTAKWISDGLTDISPGTRDVTLSWMHYDGILPFACRGRHTHPSQISDATVTLHHCLFEHGDSHSPRVDGAEARVHIFDNLVKENGGYAVGSACGAQVLLESTTFETVMTPTTRRDCGEGTPMGLISAAEGANLYLEDVGAHGGGDGEEPADAVFSPPYDYEAEREPAAAAWPEVQRRAGVGGPWKLPLALEP